MKDLLITSSVLILAILLIRFLFRNAISRRVQYALWALVLLRLLVPVSLPALRHNVLSAAQPVSVTVAAAVETPVYRLPYASYPVTAYTQEELPETEPGTVLFEGEGSYGVVDGESENVVFYRQRISPAQVLRAVWYVGMAVMAIWLLAANLRFARRLRRTRVPLEGVAARCPVYLCDDVPSPCLFGLWWPAIYVTSDAAKDPERLRYVIAHEETHARQLDPLWSLLRGVCLVIWWFDPLAWLAAYCAKADCELACDEGTLARLGETARVAYGETLLALIPRRRGGSPVVTATTMTAGKRQLRDRLRRIAEKRKPVAVALVLALALVLAACAVTFTGEAKQQSAGEAPAPAPASASDLTTPTPAPASTTTASPTALPEGEPWAVIPLDELAPSALPPVTMTEHRSDCAERIGGWTVRDGFTVRLYRSTDGNTYAAVVDRDEDGVWEARSFFTFPDKAKNPGVAFFRDLFGYDEGLIVSYDGEIARNTFGKRCNYFAFAENGTPTLVAEMPCFNELPYVTDLDGDGTNELVSAGWQEAWLYFRCEGASYCAVPVCALLQPYLGDATVYGTGFDANYRCLYVTGDRGGLRFVYQIYFDGDRLLVYKNPAPVVNDHVLEGVSAPPEVMADALAIARSRAQAMRVCEPDDWCVSALEYTLCPRGDWSIEAYRMEMMFHTPEPEKVVVAGGAYVTEEGWIAGLYEPTPYLFYLLDAAGTHSLLDGSISEEVGAGNLSVFPAGLDYIELRNGLRGPETVEDDALWLMFQLCDAAGTLNAVGEADESVRTDALERLAAGAWARSEGKNLAAILDSFAGSKQSETLTDAGLAALEELRALAGA